MPGNTSRFWQQLQVGGPFARGRFADLRVGDCIWWRPANELADHACGMFTEFTATIDRNRWRHKSPLRMPSAGGWTMEHLSI